MPLPVKIKPRNNRRKKEYLQPDGIKIIFGCLPPITVMIRPLHSTSRKYVKPGGADKIVVIGFISQNEFGTRGFGFKKLYNLLNPYNEPFCLRERSRFDPKVVNTHSNTLKLITSGLVATTTAAFCVLIKANSPNVEYGFLMVDTDDNNRFMLGTLSKHILGREAWIDKIMWQLKQSKRKEIRNIHNMDNAMLPGAFWTDFTSLAKNTSLRMQPIVQKTISVKEFEKVIDDLLHHARIIGNNAKWLCGIMTHLRAYAKSKEAHLALKKGIKKVEEFKL